MKKDIILVPTGKCPADVLADMGERIRNSWIFLHQSAYESMLDSCDSFSITDLVNHPKLACFEWHAAEDYPKTVIFCDIPNGTWGKINSIEANDIAYSSCPSNPESIYYLKMDE